MTNTEFTANIKLVIQCLKINTIYIKVYLYILHLIYIFVYNNIVHKHIYSYMLHYSIHSTVSSSHFYILTLFLLSTTVLYHTTWSILCAYGVSYACTYQCTFIIRMQILCSLACECSVHMITCFVRVTRACFEIVPSIYL